MVLCGSQSDEGLFFQAANQQDQPQFPRETSGEGLPQQLQRGGTLTLTLAHTRATQGQFPLACRDPPPPATEPPAVTPL